MSISIEDLQAVRESAVKAEGFLTEVEADIRGIQQSVATEATERESNNDWPQEWKDSDLGSLRHDLDRIQQDRIHYAEVLLQSINHNTQRLIEEYEELDATTVEKTFDSAILDFVDQFRVTGFRLHGQETWEKIKSRELKFEYTNANVSNQANAYDESVSEFLDKKNQLLSLIDSIDA